MKWGRRSCGRFPVDPVKADVYGWSPSEIEDLLSDLREKT